MAENAADKSSKEAAIASIARRQDRLLNELDELNQRIEQTLAELAGALKP